MKWAKQNITRLTLHAPSWISKRRHLKCLVSTGQHTHAHTHELCICDAWLMMMERTTSTPSSGVYIKRAHLETQRVSGHLLAASYSTISKNTLNFTRRLLPVVLIIFTSTYEKTPMTLCSAAEGMPRWIPPVSSTTQEACLSAFLQSSPRHIPNEDSHARSAVVVTSLCQRPCWRRGKTSTCKYAGDVYILCYYVRV